MKAITTKKGPFAFGGLAIVFLQVGQVFAGDAAKQLITSGWATEYDEEREADDVAALIAQKEAQDAQAIKDAEAAAKAILDAQEKERQEKDAADIKAKHEADELAEMNAVIERENAAKAKSESKRKGK